MLAKLSLPSAHGQRKRDTRVTVGFKVERSVRKLGGKMRWGRREGEREVRKANRLNLGEVDDLLRRPDEGERGCEGRGREREPC